MFNTPEILKASFHLQQEIKVVFILEKVIITARSMDETMSIKCAHL